MVESKVLPVSLLFHVTDQSGYVVLLHVRIKVVS